MGVDPRKQGEELNILASVLFRLSSKHWYRALFLELAVGLISALVLVFEPEWLSKRWFAIVLICFYVVAYSFRLYGSHLRLQAETIRRQSVFTEALGWEIPQTQIMKWRERAGTRTIDIADQAKRDSDYYATRSNDPVEKLSHMTTESAFYTRKLYRSLSILLGSVALLTSLIVIVALTHSFYFDERSLNIPTVALSVLSVLISLDVIGWTIRLHSMSDDIQKIEEEFSKIGRQGSRKLETVMRLVGEYNCTVVGGIPIHEKWFDHHHDSINREWRMYIKGNGKLPG